MSEAIRTRCKFRGVGVENTGSFITEKCREGHPDFETFGGTTYGTSPNREKYRIVTDKFCQNVRLAASYDSSNPEDVSFAEATPSGELKIFVSSPNVVGSFKPGSNYFLDLIPC